MSKFRELARLTRYPLAPTAAADVIAAAALFGTDGSLLRVVPAAAGSLCLYAAGMVQNDLADRKRDAKLHPDRPLVRDPSLVFSARIFALVLFLVGCSLCAVAGALLPAILVTALATAYNLGLKLRFPHDAITMGCVRAANLGIGVAAASGTWGTETITYLAAYFLFIGGLTGASRAEDMDPAPTRRLAVFLSILPQVLALGAFASLTEGKNALGYLAPLAVLVFGVVQSLAAGTREAVQTHVRRSLMTTFLIHVVALWNDGNKVWMPVVILLGFASYFLMSVARKRKAAGVTPNEPEADTPGE